mmetsp:Transcript_11180/g.20119  ORF Transcript_11180/g.20119 Transcript_11180/m.20119 type:complete len:206 (+) Transcript_11180:716-1333(+)
MLEGPLLPLDEELAQRPPDFLVGGRACSPLRAGRPLILLSLRLEMPPRDLRRQRELPLDLPFRHLELFPVTFTLRRRKILLLGLQHDHFQFRLGRLLRLIEVPQLPRRGVLLSLFQRRRLDCGRMPGIRLELPFCRLELFPVAITLRRRLGPWEPLLLRIMLHCCIHHRHHLLRLYLLLLYLCLPRLCLMRMLYLLLHLLLHQLL